jgi:aryl-alcohol dehydrogenase-like predicted oxidoreductase
MMGFGHPERGWQHFVSVLSAPMVGVTRDAHLDDDVAAVDLRLSGDEAARLEEPYSPHAVVGF